MGGGGEWRQGLKQRRREGGKERERAENREEIKAGWGGAENRQGRTREKE